MRYIFQQNTQFLSALNNNWRWFLAWGIILVLLGMLAIATAAFTTVISMIFLGFLLFAAGVVIIMDTFHFWWHHWKGFFTHSLVGVLYALLGLMIMFGPIPAAVSITLILGVIFVIVGVFRIFNAFTLKLPGWGWNVLNGLVTLALGTLIIAQWPVSGLYIIGLFIGIDLLLVGWTYIMISMFARKSLQGQSI
jgi:uncharacterized membrane protein HdeD (DUF308 family)